MKVAIVGNGPTKELAPYDDQEWDIWGYDKPQALQRVTLAFDVPNSYTTPAGKLISFPADTILHDFGPYWFTSAPAWLMPLALLAGTKTIGIYGTQLSEHERSAMYYWMWASGQLKVAILIPKYSEFLIEPKVYGRS